MSNIYYVGKVKFSSKMFARDIVTCDAVTQAFGACVKFVEKNHFYSECCCGKWACRFLLCVKSFMLCQSQDNGQKRTSSLKDYFCFELSWWSVIGWMQRDNVGSGIVLCASEITLWLVRGMLQLLENHSVF